MAVLLRRLSTYASVSCPQYKLLESSLSSILSLVNPLEEDRVKRLNAINEFTSLVQSIENLQDVTVKPFGSFVSNLYTRSGDLDLSIEVPHDPDFPIERSSKLFLLLDIMKALQNTGAGHNFKLLPLARVPLLVFENCYQNINCDVTVDNPMAIIKTHLIHRISNMDWRFRDLVLLIKEWANAYNINNAKQRTLNSLSIYLLVMFHFQTCKPAILPPLRDIYKGNVVSDITGKKATVSEIEDIFAANIAKFKSENKSSVYQLFISFFEKFSTIHSISNQQVICTYSGRLENILSNPQWLGAAPFDKLFIEDPFRRPENASCAVGMQELVRIGNAFAETHERLSSSAVLSNRDDLLTTLVRPTMLPKLGVRPLQEDVVAISQLQKNAL